MRPLLFILHICAAASLSRGVGQLSGGFHDLLKLESAARRLSESLAAGRAALAAGSTGSADAPAGTDDEPATDTWSQQTVFMRHMPSANLVICGCGKCGTTSLYRYIYKQLFGHEWEYKDWPFPQDLLSERWHGLFRNVNNYSQQRQVMSSSSTLSFALIRDPFDRLVSAWKSKLSCDSMNLGVDSLDRAHILPQLFRLAEEDAANRRCLSLSEFLTVYGKIQRLGRAKFLDVHFLPQNLGCFNRFPPEKWSAVTAIKDGEALVELSRKYLGGTSSVVKEEHASLNNFTVPADALQLLNNVTKEEYEMLSQYLEADASPTI